MASMTKFSFHKRLFLQLIAFSWAIVLCFIGYQYAREKEYKSEFLNAQLQQYNRHLLTTVEEGEPFEDYIATHDKPFDELRISIITLSGAVIYDNTIPVDSLDNHRYRPEVADALVKGVELYVVYRAATNQREKQRREYEVVYCLHNVNVGGDKATKIYRSIPSRKVKNRNP